MPTTLKNSAGRGSSPSDKTAKKAMAPASAARREAPIDDENFRLAGGRERYGDQTAAQRKQSAQQAGAGSVGGQNSRDQGYVDPASAKRGAEGSTGAPQAAEAPAQELPGYESDTRDNFSRMYAEHLRRQREDKSPTDPARTDGPPTEARR